MLSVFFGETIHSLWLRTICIRKVRFFPHSNRKLAQMRLKDILVIRQNLTGVHFEEFNQLLGRRAGGDGGDKYEAAYDNRGAFIRNTPGCTPIEALRLYRRVLVCILTGNTAAHLETCHVPSRRGTALDPGLRSGRRRPLSPIPDHGFCNWQRGQPDDRRSASSPPWRPRAASRTN